jgi:hypothetical protein
MLNNQTEMAHVRMDTFFLKKSWMAFVRGGRVFVPCAITWPPLRGEADVTPLSIFLHFDREKSQTNRAESAGGGSFFPLFLKRTGVGSWDRGGGGGLTDLDGGDAEAAGLEQDADAAGRHALAQPAHHAAGHQHVLHGLESSARRVPAPSARSPLSRARVARSLTATARARGRRGFPGSRLGIEEGGRGEEIGSACRGGGGRCKVFFGWGRGEGWGLWQCGGGWG